MRVVFSIFFFSLLVFDSARCKYFPDEVNSVLYDLSISGFPLNEEAKNEQFQSTSDSATNPEVLTDLMSIGNKFGQKYQCRFPVFTERPPGSDEGLLDPPLTAKVTNEEIRGALDPALKGLCFKNTRDRGGWWTYEFCYKDTIMQYHLENDNKRTGETIYLGRFESEKDWSTPQAQAELSSKRKKTLYHSQYYTNGTICDLTQKFRRTEVRFMCYEELAKGAFLQSVDEPESCEYVLTIYTADLCRLPAFLPADRKPPPLKIECQPVLSAVEYEKYMKAKQDEEAKKAEEAARKKEELELKQKIEAEKKKYQRPETPRPPAAVPVSKPNDDKAKAKQKEEKMPVLHILGRSKTDFMKPILAREAAIAAGKSIEDANKEAEALENSERVLGAVGTIEYEFLTNWFEQELQDLVTEDDDLETDEKDLSELEKYAVNEFKRNTRRISLMAAFQERLEEMVDEVFFTVTQYDARVKALKGQKLKQAKQEIEEALTAAFSHLLSSLESTERDMELLEEKTDASGVAAFERMREMHEARQKFLQELEDSKLDPAEFVKAKIAAMKPLTVEQMKELGYTDDEIAESLAEVGTAKDAAAVDGKPASTVVGDTSKASPDPKSVSTGFSKSLKGNQKESEMLNKLVKGKEPAQDSSKAPTFRQEMEDQVGKILGDVERELKEDGVFDDLNQEELADAKTEAFRSLARTLTNLLERLDETERDAEGADDQLADKSKKSGTGTPSSSKNAKDKNMEKKLDFWRKLVQGLEDDEAKASDSPQRKPLGKIQVKRGDAAASTGNEGVRVKVSTLKKKDDNQEASGDGAADISGSSKLEQRIAEKLKQAGFDTQGRPVQVKIITNFDADDSDSLIHSLSEEESEQFTNIVYAILGGASVEQTAEQRRQESLESSYNFGGTTDNEESKGKRPEHGPMKTVTMGGGGQ